MQSTLQALVIFEKQAVQTFLANTNARQNDSFEERLKRVEYK